MPPFPEEVDVFTVPHSRMKQLVEVYSEKLTCTDFTDYAALESLLHNLHNTFCEFKCHEQIENKYIMRKLKNRLKDLSIHNAAVCNCHSDNQLSDILELVKDGYSCTQKSVSERMNFGERLQNALEEFTGVFLPHMKEEEEVFQPMLIKYFGYEELKSLKEQVIEEHTKFQYVNNIEKSSYEEAEADLKADNISTSNVYTISKLPSELLTKIFTHLSPRDLLLCSQVCSKWDEIAHDPLLWRNLYPTHWAKGEWEIRDSENLEPLMSECCKRNMRSIYYDEDADFDESSEDEMHGYEACSSCMDISLIRRQKEILTGMLKYLLPRVGSGVQKIILTSNSSLNSNLLHKILLLCPNITHLDVSYTSISDSSFKGLTDCKACSKLEYLDLSGCVGFTDLGICRLADALSSDTTFFNASSGYNPENFEEVDFVNSSNCEDVICQYSKAVSSEHENNIFMKSNCFFEIEDSENVVKGEKLTCDNKCCRNMQCYGSNCRWNKDIVLCKLARLAGECPALKSGICCRLQSYATENGSYSESNRTLNDDMNSFRGEFLEPTFNLKFLNLSGCYMITDDGLRYVAESGILTSVKHLDVSGCWNLTGPGLTEVVSLAPSLLPQNLFYCNHIKDGPYPDDANGCQNLETGTRACCCSGQ